MDPVTLSLIQAFQLNHGIDNEKAKKIQKQNSVGFPIQKKEM